MKMADRLKPFFASLALAVLLAPLVPQTAKAQFYDHRRGQYNVLKINIVSPVMRTFSVAYERELFGSSFQLGATFTKGHFGKKAIMGEGYSIIGEYRAYLTDRRDGAVDGWFIGPYFKTQSYTLEADNYEFNLSGKILAGSADFKAYGGGLVVGRQVVFGMLTAEYFVGGGYHIGTLRVHPDSEINFTKLLADLEDYGFISQFGLRAGVTVGLVF